MNTHMHTHTHTCTHAHTHTHTLHFQVTIKFCNNTAILGSALLVSRLGPCSWLSLAPPYFNNTFILDWPIWEFGWVVADMVLHKMQKHIYIRKFTDMPSPASRISSRLSLITGYFVWCSFGLSCHILEFTYWSKSSFCWASHMLPSWLSSLNSVLMEFVDLCHRDALPTIHTHACMHTRTHARMHGHTHAHTHTHTILKWIS